MRISFMLALLLALSRHFVNGNDLYSAFEVWLCNFSFTITNICATSYN
jgi:hypothetical protein